MRLFYLVLGGVAGTVSRYALSSFIHESTGRGFPYGTLAVNGLGCLIIGGLTTVSGGRFFADDNMRMLLAVGFCGAFTTFSSFILDTAHLAKGPGYMHALVNVALSMVVGVVTFVVGRKLGRII